MNGQDQRVGAGDGRKEFPTRDRLLLRVPVGLRRPFRLAALDRVMHEIARDHRALALREDVDAAMTRRMPRRRRQRNGIVERVIVVNQQGLSGLDDRQEIFAKNPAGRVGTLGILRLLDCIFLLLK